MKQIALVIALCLGTVAVQAAGGVPVPFRASIDTVVTPLGPCGPTCLTLSISGSGQALHMGQATIDGPSQIDFSTLEQSGTSTLTAADGSTLTIAFDGHFVPGPGPEDASFSGTWEVLFGTGRFEGASGGGAYHGSASGSAGVLHMQGTVAAPRPS